jgi:hypothetical protein
MKTPTKHSQIIKMAAAERYIKRALSETSQSLAELTSMADDQVNDRAIDQAIVEDISQAVGALGGARRAVRSAMDSQRNNTPDTQPTQSDAISQNPWAPDEWFSSIADLTAVSLNQKTFAVDVESLLYACDLTLLPEARRLYVMLSSYLARPDEQPPKFRWARRLFDSGHVLRISDPGFFLNDELSTSCFLGVERQDGLEGAVQIAQQIGYGLGLGDEQIIYWGSSGGGFAALRAATLVTKGRAVAVNPQTEIRSFEGQPWAFPVSETFRKGWSFSDICEAYPIRTSVANALKWAIRRGATPRLVIAQNDADEMCYQDHFVPFCKEHDLDPSCDSRSKYVQTLVYHNWRGHGVAPRKVDLRISEIGLPFLLDDKSEGISDRVFPNWWDEQYYLRRYPDIAEAVRKGRLRSGLEHYQSYGAAEKRVPRPVGPEGTSRT